LLLLIEYDPITRGRSRLIYFFQGIIIRCRCHGTNLAELETTEAQQILNL